jgi:hypothetical protein
VSRYTQLLWRWWHSLLLPHRLLLRFNAISLCCEDSKKTRKTLLSLCNSIDLSETIH